eukprot:675323-Prymnesium_polylepis.1
MSSTAKTLNAGGGVFSRVGRRRPDSSGVERPSSGRSSFVDRLRSMQLDPLRRNSRSGTPGATTG